MQRKNTEAVIQDPVETAMVRNKSNTELPSAC